MADITGFTNFLYNTVGIPQPDLPNNAPIITDAYNWGVAVVPCEFMQVSGAVYDQVVYNVGTSYLFNWAPDQPNMNYFATMRSKWGLINPMNGILTSSSDNGTSAGYTVPDWVKHATLMELQWLKDPFGRQAFAIMQNFGSLWGLS